MKRIVKLVVIYLLISSLCLPIYAQNAKDISRFSENGEILADQSKLNDLNTGYDISLHYTNFEKIAATTLQEMSRYATNYPSSKRAIFETRLEIDSPREIKTMGSITVDLKAASAASTDILLPIYIDEYVKDLYEFFEKFYCNKLLIIKFAQPDSFGIPVDVCIRAPQLNDFDMEDLSIYSYDSEQNIINSINITNATFDDLYLRFQTSKAGIIVISEGKLKLK
ncbi:hypothetical protein [Anaerotruncus rubiinfantis]|uniref:hypothetical protein n=1 Tax=Anaerotruncus rubiinfantis TaxID=1720200 RepID=UPI00082D6202|nr:hypothetical protein [Anaerotruncus rubiinfantis]